MRITDILAIVSLATACLIHPVPAGAGKPSGGGSGIKVEELLKPAGSRDAYAADINDSGTIAVGAAYWNATWDYTNNYYPVRWTRASTSDPWVAEDLRLKFPPNADTRAYLVNDAGTIVLLSFWSPYHLVMTSTGDVIDIGAATVNALSNNDTMVGYRSGTPDSPLFWASPSSPPEELPPLASGYSAMASLFQGADVIGWAEDVHVIDTKRGRVQVATAPYPMRNRLLAQAEHRGKSIEELDKALQDIVGDNIRALGEQRRELVRATHCPAAAQGQWPQRHEFRRPAQPGRVRAVQRPVRVGPPTRGVGPAVHPTAGHPADAVRNRGQYG
jgi:hypothetical protein